jgi:hypothetical protein
MAAPTFYTAGLKTYSSSPAINTTTSHSITKPDDVVAGDLILLILSSAAQQTAGVFPFTWPEGFTPIGVSANGASNHRTCAGAAYKIAGGSEPASYSFDYNQHPTVNYTFRAVAVRVTDHDPTTPAGAFSGAHNSSSSDTSVTVGTLTADADSLLVGHLQYQGASGNTITPPSGFNARSSATSGAGYNTSERSWAGGATGSLVFSMSLGAHATSIVFAINGGAATKLISASLKELDGITNLPESLTGVRWAWFDTEPGTGQSTPIDYGTNLLIENSGQLEIVLPNTTLTSGQYGYLVLEHVASGRRQAYRLQVIENA